MGDRRVIIVAQTPPPFHGQAIMQQFLVEEDWTWCDKQFVRMNFSDEIGEVGVFKAKKVLQLFGLLSRVRKKAKPKTDLVYYPPAGPHRIPIYRDVLILCYLKLVSRKIILHFHAGGINQIFSKVTSLEAALIKKAFRNVDAAVVLTGWLENEVTWCKPKKIFVVNNGIKDVFRQYGRREADGTPVSFMFIGNLKKEKGIFTLLEAALKLKNTGESFRVKFIGAFHSDDEKQQFFSFVTSNKLGDDVFYLGTKSGDEKWEEFERADVFCLPTYETEAMPISILEAMMFQLPVITTRWRSIPDIIRHEENGLLFDPQNATQLAACMKRLLHDGNNRKRLGLQARTEFLQHYTVEQHLAKMENVFKAVLNH